MGYSIVQIEIVDFGPHRFEWIYRLHPVPDEVFRPALLLCIERYTVVGVAVLIGSSSREVLHWRQGRRNAKPMARRAVMLLSVASLKAIESLAAQIPTDSVVDQPVNKTKRTPQVVVSESENKSLP